MQSRRVIAIGNLFRQPRCSLLRHFRDRFLIIFNVRDIGFHFCLPEKAFFLDRLAERFQVAVEIGDELVVNRLKAMDGNLQNWSAVLLRCSQLGKNIVIAEQ